MHLSENGIKLLAQFEGCILFAYDDFDSPKSRRHIKPGDKVHGTLTIGFGHTGADVKPGMTITADEAEDLLRKDLGPFESAVDLAVTTVLNQHQFDALVIFAFNVGMGNFRGSTLLRKLNSGQYTAVPSELMKWTKSKGKQMQGLVNRRKAEATLWSGG